MAYAFNTFDAWLRAKGFGNALDSDSELKDGTAQGFFSTQYTAWLNELIANYADAIRIHYGLASDTLLQVTVNPSDTSGLPTISGLTRAQVDELFNDTSDFTWTSGSARHLVLHERFYSNAFNFALFDNHAPVADTVGASGAEDTPPIAVILTGSDPDFDDAVASFTLTSLPSASEGTLYLDSNASVLVSAGVAYAASAQSLTLYFVPAANFNGAVQLTYTASDGDLSSTAATATIHVTQVNDPASFGGQISGSGSEDGEAIAGTLTVSDSADGATNPNFRILSGDGPAHGAASIDAVTGQWSYMPDANFNGSDHFTVSVTDDDSNVETQVIEIAVRPVMDFAILVSPASLVVSGGPTQLIYGQVFEAGVTEASGAASAIVAQLGYGAAGTDPAGDPGWTWLSASFSGQVGNNDEYVATIDAQSLTSGKYSYTYRFGFSDDGQTPLDWTYADLDGTANGFSFTQLGLMTVEVSSNVNRAPIAGDDSVQVFVNSEIEAHAPGVLANDTDPDGDTLEVVAINGDASHVDDGNFITLPSGAHIQVFSDGAYDYLPDAPLFYHMALGESYVDTITYTIQDSHGLKSDGKLVITVNGILPGSGPVAVDDSGATDEDTAFFGSGQFGLLYNDSDFDGQGALIVAAINGSEAAVGHQVALASGALLTVLPDGTYHYDPNDQFNFLQSGEFATDSFDYAVANSAGLWATATVTITIEGVDEVPPPPIDPHAPVAVNDVAQVFVDSEVIALAPGLLANDYDPDAGDVIEVATIGGHAADGNFVPLPSGAMIQAFNDGTYDYVPATDAFANLAPGESYVDTIPYTIRDSSGLTSDGTLEITVIAPDVTLEAPITLTIEPGQTPQVYGRISAAELTEPLGFSPTIVAQFGYGVLGTNPKTSASWIWSDASFNTQLANGDEYVTSIPDDLSPGNYAYAYRFGLSTDGQTPISWVYADLDGSGNGFQFSQLGSLFVI
jgi:VCBS repeat-containing protein